MKGFFSRLLQRMGYGTRANGAPGTSVLLTPPSGSYWEAYIHQPQLRCTEDAGLILGDAATLELEEAPSLLAASSEYGMWHSPIQPRTRSSFCPSCSPSEASSISPTSATPETHQDSAEDNAHPCQCCGVLRNVIKLGELPTETPVFSAVGSAPTLPMAPGMPRSPTSPTMPTPPIAYTHPNQPKPRLRLRVTNLSIIEVLHREQAPKSSPLLSACSSSSHSSFGEVLPPERRTLFKGIRSSFFRPFPLVMQPSVTLDEDHQNLPVLAEIESHTTELVEPWEAQAVAVDMAQLSEIPIPVGWGRRNMLERRPWDEHIRKWLYGVSQNTDTIEHAVEDPEHPPGLPHPPGVHTVSRINDVAAQVKGSRNSAAASDKESSPTQKLLAEVAQDLEFLFEDSAPAQRPRYFGTASVKAKDLVSGHSLPSSEAHRAPLPGHQVLNRDPEYPPGLPHPPASARPQSMIKPLGGVGLDHTPGLSPSTHEGYTSIVSPNDPTYQGPPSALPPIGTRTVTYG